MHEIGGGLRECWIRVGPVRTADGTRGTALWDNCRLPRGRIRVASRTVIRAELKDAAFLADVARAADETAHFNVWWLGQSGFLVAWAGHKLLLDPYLSDSLTHKYAGTDKPHVRMTERVVDPALLTGIEVVTSSHNHTDHLDGETLKPLFQSNPAIQMIVPEANRAFAAQRIGVPSDRLLGLSEGGAVRSGPFEIHAIPSAHEALDVDAHGRHIYLGYVLRFGSWCLYHSGDTVGYPSLVERLRKFPIDVAMLPINGRAPERRVAGNLDGEEAARLARDAGVRFVIPCHFNLFEFNTADPSGFLKACSAYRVRSRVLGAGSRWSSRELDSATP